MTDGENNIMLMVSIVSTLVGFAGVVFGIYKHVSSKKEARLVYEISQLSDFGIPNGFLKDVTSAPISIVVENIGNKSAKNIKIKIQTKSSIEKRELHSDNPDSKIDAQKSEVNYIVGEINPSESVKLVLICDGSPYEDQIQGLSITHSEGEAINKKEPITFSIKSNLLMLGLHYDGVKKTWYVETP